MSVKIIIVGPAASGKSTLAKQLQAKGFKVAKLHTTRPKRDENDDEYIFNYKDVKYPLASCTFNGWDYAVTYKSLIESDIFIVGPKMAQMMKDKAPEHNFLTIFLNIPEHIRYERLMKRDMPGDSVIGRIGRDRADFANFTDYTIMVTDPNF